MPSFLHHPAQRHKQQHGAARAAWREDPLARLPEALQGVVLSYLSQRDALQCRLASRCHWRAVPQHLRRLQLLQEHVDKIDWAAFASLRTLIVGPGATATTARAATVALLAAPVPPPCPFAAAVTLREVQLVGTRLGDARLSEMWAGLAALPRLQSLNLEGNELTAAGVVPSLRNALEVERGSSSGGSSGGSRRGFPMLRELRIPNNRLGDDGLASLLGALASSAAGGRRRLAVLDASDNGLGGRLAATTAALRGEGMAYVEELWLGYNDDMGDAGLAALASVLAGGGRDRHPSLLPRLRRLELAHAGIGDQGARALAEALLARGAGAVGITSINLASNGVGDRGVRALAAALGAGACPSLVRLDLSGNSVARGGAKALARMLASGRTQLRELRLSWNFLGDSAMAAFCAAAAAAAVVKQQKQRREQEQEQEDGDRPSAEEAEAEAPPSFFLELLELSNNNIGDAGARALARALRTAPPLARVRSIDLSGNDFHEAGLMAVAAAAAAAASEDKQRQQHQRSREELESTGASRPVQQQQQQRHHQQQRRQHDGFPDVRVYDGLLLGDLMGWTTQQQQQQQPTAAALSSSLSSPRRTDSAAGASAAEEPIVPTTAAAGGPSSAQEEDGAAAKARGAGGGGGLASLPLLRHLFMWFFV